MIGKLVCGCLVLAGCGRLGFDERAPADAALPAMVAPPPSHRYQLDGNFADDLGGPAAACHDCASPDFTANGYHFAKNEGLMVAGAIGPDVYTIDLVMAFDSLGSGDMSYRKMIDFKDLGRDEGLYARLAGLQLITEHDNPDGMFASPDQLLEDDVLAEFTMTRDSNGHIAIYLDHRFEIGADDPLGAATFTGTNAHFGDDDTAVPTGAGSGTIRQLTIWDTALTAGQIAALPALAR